jgi:heptosyltransferase-3
MNVPSAVRKSVLVYRLGSLGDTLLALPVFHSIRRKYPDSRIVALTNIPVNAKAPALLTVLQGTGLIDGAINYPLGLRDTAELLRLRREIAVERFAVAVNLTAARGWWKGIRDKLFLHLCGIPKVLGTPWRRADVIRVGDRESGLFEWEAKRLARRALAIGDIDLVSNESWELNLTSEEIAIAERILIAGNIDRPFVAVSVGTKVDVKDWTEPNWRSFIRELSDRFPITPIVAFGSEEESDRTEKCLEGWGGPKLNLCGKVSLRVLAAVLRKSKLFIGHDSGPMHLAATVGVPCVAIFAARNLPGQWYPRGHRNTVLYNQTSCYGCELEVCPVYDKMCIRGITVSEVVNAAVNYLRVTEQV